MAKEQSKTIKLVQSKLNHKNEWVREYVGVGFRKSDKQIRIKMNMLPIADKNGEIWLDLWLNDQ